MSASAGSSRRVLSRSLVIRIGGRPSWSLPLLCLNVAVRPSLRSSSARAFEVDRVQKYRHGPIVDECDFHVGAENAALAIQAVLGEGIAEGTIDWLCAVWTGCCCERRPTTAARVRVQRKLTYGQHSAADFLHRPVHLAIGVLEDSQFGNLPRKASSERLAVPFGDSHK